MSQNIPPVQQAILQMLSETAVGKSIGPTDIARHLAGNDEKQWSKLSKTIRAEAVQLALDGKIHVLRKGKIADPENFKGVYRLTLVNAEEKSL